MKNYSPGASVKHDYSYICDKCEIDDGRATLIWDPLPGRKGHFAICLNCLLDLNQQFNSNYPGTAPLIEITRIIIPERLRNEIYERDNYKCVKCGDSNDLQLDHVIPFSKGGRTERKNLQTLCKACNLRKSDG
jgi:5-methylcytosine-specific restriction endonuclease McrA